MCTRSPHILDPHFDSNCAFRNPGPYLQQRDAALSQRHEILVQTYFETVSLAGLIPGDEGLCSNGPSPTDKRMRSLWPREHAAMTPGGRLAVAVCCGQQILEALKYVHAAGLIHGDVSMANILIGGLKQEDLAALSVVSEDRHSLICNPCDDSVTLQLVDSFQEGIADIPWRKEERSAVYRRCLDHMESYLVDFGVCTNWADAYGAHEPLNQSTAQVSWSLVYRVSMIHSHNSCEIDYRDSIVCPSS